MHRHTPPPSAELRGGAEGLSIQDPAIPVSFSSTFFKGPQQSRFTPGAGRK